MEIYPAMWNQQKWFLSHPWKCCCKKKTRMCEGAWKPHAWPPQFSDDRGLGGKLGDSPLTFWGDAERKTQVASYLKFAE